MVADLSFNFENMSMAGTLIFPGNGAALLSELSLGRNSVKSFSGKFTNHLRENLLWFFGQPVFEGHRINVA